MSRKFFYLLLTMLLMTSLIACNKTNTSNNSTTSNFANNSTTTTNPIASSNPTTNSENVHPVGDPKSPYLVPVNVEAGKDATLPNDVPLFPNSTPLDKRQTNKITTFIFTTDAIRTEVENFYKDALKKEGWSHRLEQQNVADGYFFLKPKRTLRVVAYKDGQLNKTVFRLSVSSAEGEENKAVEIMGEDGKPVKRVMAANLSEAGRMPNIINSIPLYPSAEKKLSERAGIWWEYKSKDPVKKIADWYDKELKAIGWTLEQDNSELGDSMMIYHKKDEKGNNINVGIRVNDMKEKSERWITVINYPYNSVIPDLKPISEVEKEQPEATRIAKEIAKKNQEKNKSSEPSKEITPEMLAEISAAKEANKERVKKMMEERQKAREKALNGSK
ncbi:MAG: hypothetical protein HY819_21150 [Acidobacteria bacterium]|nr:hypothetical protein [Acidobacteriota bacterium]